MNIYRWKFLKFFRAVIFILLALQLSACAIGRYGSEGRSREEFAKYVENVFRLQNKVTSQIMILTDSGNSHLQEPLSRAEQRMQEMCSSINEYAARDIDGLNISFFLRRRVEKSAEDCEKAAQEVETLLNGI
jgi:hypothetical protein